jgi:hypothetical protein
MPVKIRIYGKEAVFTRGCWTCEDESLLAMLESLADPRAVTEAEEHAHALYAAGRYGGVIAVGEGWEAAPHPAPEIRLEDFAPARQPERAGWLSFLRRRK